MIIYHLSNRSLLRQPIFIVIWFLYMGAQFRFFDKCASYHYFNTLLQHLHRGVLLTEIWVIIGKMITNY